MNFTREPIIETIITPKEGYKLVLRNTKGAHSEEHCVDAVEVVSFGNSIFYRSLERPKSFLLPVSDYEIQESREARIALKNATLEKSVKIPSGNEKQGSSHQSQDDAHHQEKKRERKKQKKKKENDSIKEELQEVVEHTHQLGEDIPEVAPKEKETPPPAILSKLFPPPQNLISESISRYKQQEALAAAEKKEDEIQLVEKDREELLQKLEAQDNKLDHIWTVEEEKVEVQSEDSFEKVKHFQMDDEVFFSPVDEEYEIAPRPLSEETPEHDRTNVFINDLLPDKET